MPAFERFANGDCIHWVIQFLASSGSKYDQVVVCEEVVQRQPRNAVEGCYQLIEALVTAWTVTVHIDLGTPACDDELLGSNHKSYNAAPERRAIGSHDLARARRASKSARRA